MANQTIQTIIVKAPLSKVYGIWANFENFSSFMNNIESVTKTGPDLSHWVMSGPLGFKVEWDAETTMMEENKRIAWNSRDRSALTTSGQVTFKELPNDSTEITVTLSYDPPAGTAGEIVAALFAQPEKRLSEDLHNFKVFAETKRQEVGR